MLLTLWRCFLFSIVGVWGAQDDVRTKQAIIQRLPVPSSLVSLRPPVGDADASQSDNPLWSEFQSRCRHLPLRCADTGSLMRLLRLRLFVCLFVCLFVLLLHSTR